MTNYFDAEELLKARLRDKVSSVPNENILSACDISEVLNSTQVCPSISVIYRGDLVGSNDARGLFQTINQQWQIVVTTQNLSSAESSTGITSAGGIIGEMIEALLGHRLSGQGGRHDNLILVRAPDRPYYVEGFAYFSYMFSTGIQLKGIRE